MTKLKAQLIRAPFNGGGGSALQQGSEALAHRVVEACLDAKGREITVLDVHDVFDLSDFFVIASGRSDRQVQGIANRVLEALEAVGIEPDYVEGYEEAQWIIIDLIDVVVHIFYEPLREQFDLEGLWVKAKRMPIEREKPLPSSLS